MLSARSALTGAPKEAVLFCHICGKPFDKESSRNRHVAYCKRTQGRTRLRKKPCNHCIRSKSKCTFQVPCSRCLKKNLGCTYDQASPRDLARQRSASLGGLERNQDQPRGTSELALGAHIVPLSLVSDPRSADYSEWISSGSPADRHSSCRSEQALSPVESLPVVLWATASASTATGIWSTWTHPNNIFPALDCSDQAHSEAGKPLFKRYLMPDPVSQHCADQLYRMIEAMPHMMLRRSTFPAFIYPRQTDEHLLEPLENCMEIAKLFASRKRNKDSLMWRTCRAEQMRLLENLEQLSGCEILASIQAMAIYVVMSAIDREFLDDEQMLRTALSSQKLFEQFRKTFPEEPFCQDERANPSSTWEGWIFTEARRRIACNWIIICRILCTNTGIPCDTVSGYKALPLPAPKSLWEARSRSEWQSEYEEHMSTSKPRLTTMGDLITIKKTELSESGYMQWCSGIDYLGVMLNLAVSLPEI